MATTTGYDYSYWAGTAVTSGSATASATCASASWVIGNPPYQTFVYGDWKIPMPEERDEILDKLFNWEE